MSANPPAVEWKDPAAVMGIPKVPIDVLTSWAGQQFPGTDAEVDARIFVSEVRDSPTFRKLQSDTVGASLAGAIEVILDISSRFDASQETLPKGDEANIRTMWFAWSREIQAVWRLPSEDCWQRLLIDLPKQGNRLISSMLACSLETCCRGTSDTIRNSLRRMMDVECRWCEGIPLPPASRFSKDDLDLIQPFVNAGLKDRMTILASDLRNRNPGSGSGSMRFMTTVHRYLDLMNYALAGWPISRRQIRERLQSVTECLDPARSHSDAGIEQRITEIIKTFDDLQPDATGESRAAACSASALASQVSGTRPESASGKAQQAMPNWRMQLRALVDDVRASPISSVAKAGKCCDAALRMVDSHRIEDADARQLLVCLMQCDQATRESGNDSNSLSELRRLLRQCLFNGDLCVPQFRLVESQLIGQPLRSWMGQVQVHEFIEHPNSATNTIVGVVTPGYESAEGETLLQACVLVAR